MIAVNELRIGNWLRFTFLTEDFKAQVTFILENSVGIKKNVSFGLENCHPIPLTPEILENSGFYHDLSKDTPEFRLINNWKKDLEFEILGMKVTNTFDLYADWEGNQCIYGTRSIRSFHHLQNLYFALTGIELEVNL